MMPLIVVGIDTADLNVFFHAREIHDRREKREQNDDVHEDDRERRYKNAAENSEEKGGIGKFIHIKPERQIFRKNGSPSPGK